MAVSDAILTRLLTLHPKIIDLSLERMERILARLGHPERNLPPVIHVAGTNGKGSTVAFCRAMIEAAGLTAHCYTSPHLVRFHERIRLGKDLIAESALSALLEECEAANGGAPITFFEITTAAAFLAFSRTPADYLILEVGLGGRLDATNVTPRPRATAITSLGLDHQQFLGETIEQIAREKAGILKRGVPAVIGRMPPEARAAIEEVAEKVGAPLAIAGQDWDVYEQHGRLVFQDGTVCSTCRCRAARCATRSTTPEMPSPSCARSMTAASAKTPSPADSKPRGGRRACNASRAVISRRCCREGPNSGWMVDTMPMPAWCWPMRCRPWHGRTASRSPSSGACSTPRMRASSSVRSQRSPAG